MVKRLTLFAASIAVALPALLASVGGCQSSENTADEEPAVASVAQPQVIDHNPAGPNFRVAPVAEAYLSKNLITPFEDINGIVTREGKDEARLYYNALWGYATTPGTPLCEGDTASDSCLDTLAKFKRKYALPSSACSCGSDGKTICYYQRDYLGLGRELAASVFTADGACPGPTCGVAAGTIAMFVTNYGHLMQEYPSALHDALSLRRRRNTVVITYTPNKLNGRTPSTGPGAAIPAGYRVNFYNYDGATGNVQFAVPGLDEKGERFVPGNCTKCHSGDYSAAEHLTFDARFLPLDFFNLVYADTPAQTVNGDTWWPGTGITPPDHQKRGECRHDVGSGQTTCTGQVNRIRWLNNIGFKQALEAGPGGQPVYNDRQLTQIRALYRMTDCTAYTSADKCGSKIDARGNAQCTWSGTACDFNCSATSEATCPTEMSTESNSNYRTGGACEWTGTACRVRHEIPGGQVPNPSPAETPIVGTAGDPNWQYVTPSWQLGTAPSWLPASADIAKEDAFVKVVQPHCQTCHDARQVFYTASWASALGTAGSIKANLCDGWSGNNQPEMPQSWVDAKNMWSKPVKLCSDRSCFDDPKQVAGSGTFFMADGPLGASGGAKSALLSVLGQTDCSLVAPSKDIKGNGCTVNVAGAPDQRASDRKCGQNLVHVQKCEGLASAACTALPHCIFAGSACRERDCSEYTPATCPTAVIDPDTGAKKCLLESGQCRTFTDQNRSCSMSAAGGAGQCMDWCPPAMVGTAGQGSGCPKWNVCAAGAPNPKCAHCGRDDEPACPTSLGHPACAPGLFLWNGRCSSLRLACWRPVLSPGRFDGGINLPREYDGGVIVIAPDGGLVETKFDKDQMSESSGEFFTVSDPAK